jgi:serine/threonine protein kinase
MGLCVYNDDIYIVTEYMDRGSLKDILRDSSVKIDWEMRLKIAIEIAQGMHYLHSLKPIVMHRDLKSANILVDKSFNAKVADFGVSFIRNSSLFTPTLGRKNLGRL